MRCVFGVLAVLLWPVQLWALPTMVRLGYPGCSPCHVAAANGGILTRYGHVIDSRHSFRRVTERASLPAFAAGFDRYRHEGRGNADIRLQLSPTPLGLSGRLRARSVWSASPQVRLALSAGMDSARAPDRTVASLKLDTATLEYRPANGWTLTAGRAAPISGLGVPDLDGAARPLAVSLSWESRHWEIAPTLSRTPGVLIGARLSPHCVLGLRTAGSHLGAYARIGTARWGLLAEHRRLQAFWAPRDWSVFSLVRGADGAVSPAAALRLSTGITLNLGRGAAPHHAYTLSVVVKST